MSNVNVVVVESFADVTLRNTIYLVRDNGSVSVFITDQNSVPLEIKHGSFLNYIVDDNGGWKFATTFVNIVESIEERDLLAGDVNLLVLVGGDDENVLYAYEAALSKWHKISNFESTTIDIGWDDVTSGPERTPSEIDEAVSKKHTHDNQEQLDKISEDSEGLLMYDEENINVMWDTLEW